MSNKANARKGISSFKKELRKADSEKTKQNKNTKETQLEYLFSAIAVSQFLCYITQRYYNLRQQTVNTKTTSFVIFLFNDTIQCNRSADILIYQ